jgi:flagellar basal-body rod modification protein FlgD
MSVSSTPTTSSSLLGGFGSTPSANTSSNQASPTSSTDSSSSNSSNSSTTTGSSTTDSASSSSTSSSLLSFGNNFNDFLTLLTAQLKNQDPLSPTDSSQFTNQLVEFSSVEQQINMNTNMKTLIALQQASQASTAVSYLGRSVEATGTSLPLANGQAQFSYTLRGAAQQVSIAIMDKNGQVVRTLQGSGDTTKQQLTWDGTDDKGSQLPDGLYTFAVSAVDKSNKAVNSTTTFTGTVSSVNGTGANVQLDVGGASVPLANIVAVDADSTSDSSSSLSSLLSNLLGGSKSNGTTSTSS